MRWRKSSGATLMKNGVTGNFRRIGGGDFHTSTKKFPCKVFIVKPGKFFCKFRLRKIPNRTINYAAADLCKNKNFPALFVIRHSPWTVIKTNSG
jgi:hypothetical protein